MSWPDAETWAVSSSEMRLEGKPWCRESFEARDTGGGFWVLAGLLEWENALETCRWEMWVARKNEPDELSGYSSFRSELHRVARKCKGLPESGGFGGRAGLRAYLATKKGLTLNVSPKIGCGDRI